MRNLGKLTSLFVGTMIAWATPSVFAQNTGSTIAAPLPEAPSAESSSKRFSGEVDLYTSRSLHQGDDVNRAADLALWLAPSLKINEDYNLSSLLTYSRDFVDPSEPNKISNLRLAVSHAPYRLSRVWSFAPTVAAKLPTNRQSREDDRLTGGVSLEPEIRFDNGGRLVAAYRFAWSRNFHEVTISRSGAANIETSYTNRLALSYRLTDLISLNAIGQFISAKTYHDYDRSKFVAAEEINYRVGPAWALTLGHSNDADALKPNQRDSNIALYNDQTSSIYMGVNYVY